MSQIPYKNELLITSVVLTQMFFTSGIDKMNHFNKVVDGFVKRFPIKLPSWMNRLTIFLVIVLEILAPITIVYAIYKEKYYDSAIIAAIKLIAFTILATLIYHSPPVGAQYYPFTSNVTTVGGLMLLVWVLYNVKSLSAHPM